MQTLLVRGSAVKVDMEEIESPPHSLRLVFGENVRLARVAAGFSQDEISLKASLHRTYIGGVERGERNLTLDNLERLADALDYPAAELLRPDFVPKRSSKPVITRIK